MKESVSVGVDLGGTKTEAVVLRYRQAARDYEVLERQRVPTPQHDGYDAVLDSTTGLVRGLLRASGLASGKVRIGVGMPGAVARSTGLVKNSNTQCLNGRPFRQDLQRRLGQAVSFDNDANCFALAETHLGAARPYREGIVFGVILGTGVGGGLIVEGSSWPGPQGIAGEWGHHAVGPWQRWDCSDMAISGRDAGFGVSERGACYCGRTGCLELYLGGPAIEADYLRRAGVQRRVPEIAERRSVDPHAQASLAEVVEVFGRALGNLISILDPSAIVLGGGVSNLDCLYSDGVRSAARYVFNDELTTPVLRHELGDSAGVLGAALLEG